MALSMSVTPDNPEPDTEVAAKLVPATRMNLENFSASVMEYARADPDVRASYDLDPPYQRGDVWAVTQKQNLVFSLLTGVPTGAIILNERHPEHEAYDPTVWQAVVDGKQRVTAMRDFVDSKFAVPAVWFADDEYGTYVDHVTPNVDYEGVSVDGVFYQDLNKQGQGRFNRSTVAVTVGKLSTIAEEARLYELINFGGVPQTDDDRQRARRVADTH